MSHILSKSCEILQGLNGPSQAQNNLDLMQKFKFGSRRLQVTLITIFILKWHLLGLHHLFHVISGHMFLPASMPRIGAINNSLASTIQYVIPIHRVVGRCAAGSGGSTLWSACPTVRNTRLSNIQYF